MSVVSVEAAVEDFLKTYSDRGSLETALRKFGESLNPKTTMTVDGAEVVARFKEVQARFWMGASTVGGGAGGGDPQAFFKAVEEYDRYASSATPQVEPARYELLCRVEESMIEFVMQNKTRSGGTDDAGSFVPFFRLLVGIFASISSARSAAAAMTTLASGECALTVNAELSGGTRGGTYLYRKPVPPTQADIIRREARNDVLARDRRNRVADFFISRTAAEKAKTAIIQQAETAHQKEARRKANAQAEKARRKAAEEARLKEAEEARQEAQSRQKEARQKAARLKAAEEARLRAAEEARLKAARLKKAEANRRIQKATTIAENRIQKFRAVNLKRTLANKSIGDKARMILQRIQNKNDLKNRIYTACFLYFVTTANVSHERAFDFMAPLVRNDEAKAKVKNTVTEVIRKYAEFETYIAHNEGDLYDIYPHMDLFWHELVDGLQVGRLLCCMEDSDREAIWNKFDKTSDYLVQSYMIYLLRLAKENNITFRDNTNSFLDCDIKRVPRLPKRNVASPDHSLYVYAVHGSCESRFTKHAEIVSVAMPYNLTMIKVGLMEEITKFTLSSLNTMCDEKKVLDNLAFRTDDMNGCDIVVPGQHYSQLYLGKKVKDMFVCVDSRQKVISVPDDIMLSDLVEIVSKDAINSKKHALLMLISCQEVDNDDHRDRRTNALITPHTALRHEPRVLNVGRRTLDIPVVIKETAKMRGERNKEIYTLENRSGDYSGPVDTGPIERQLKQMTGGNKAGLRAGIVAGLLATVAIACFR